MDTFDILLAVAAVVLVALATAWRDFGDKVKLSLAGIGLCAAYAVYCLIAVVFVGNILLTATVEAPRAVAGVVFALAWIAWGAMWLLRYLPVARGLPVMAKRPMGLPGLGLLVLGGAAFAAFAADY